MCGYSLVPAETHHSRLTRSLYLRSSFGCCPFVVRSLSVCCPFVVRSIDEQQAYDNQTSFALQSDMHRGCTLGKISILVQSFWENSIYVSRGRMFSMDIEGIIKRGRKSDKKALGCLYRAYHRQMTSQRALYTEWTENICTTTLRKEYYALLQSSHRFWA